MGKNWGNLSKRGVMDGVFWGLAGLLRGISWGRRPRESPRSSPVSLRKPPSFLTLLLRFTFYFQKVSILALLKCIDGSVLALLKSMEGSVLALLRFPWSSPTRIPRSVNSGAALLLCKKSNKTSYLNRKYSPSCECNTKNQFFQYCPPVEAINRSYFFNW